MLARLYRKQITGLLLAVPLLLSANGDLRLIDSTKVGDTITVRSLLLDKSVDVNQTSADGTSVMHWAAHRDDIELANMLLEAGANPGLANVYGVTPLNLACTNRNDVIVEKLLAAGADPNAALWTGETVLMHCVRTGTTAAVSALLNAGADPNARESNQGQTALMWAAGMGHSGIVDLLIEYEADLTSSTIPTADRLPNTCRICAWKPSEGGFTALMFAARSGDIESARLLIEAGADPNESTSQHGTPLVIASAGGHEELAIYLLNMGADPDAADENGVTALHHSFRHSLSRMHGITYDPVYRVRPDNMPRLTRALIEAGADPNVQISSSYSIGPAIRDRCESLSGMQGATPFMLAAISFDVTLMQLLKEAGADPGLSAADGTTSLMVAAQSACTRMSQRGEQSNAQEVNASLNTVKTIVQMGVDVNAVTTGGETAMHMAAFAGAEPVVQFLASNGAQVNVKNNFGETPWSMASGLSADISDRGSYGIHPDTAALLLQLGAVPISRDDMLISDSYSNFTEKAISIDLKD